MKNTEADTRPCSPLCQLPLKVSKVNSFEVVFSRPTQAFEAARVLLSKHFSGYSWNEAEEVLYFASVDYINSLRSNDNFNFIQDIKCLALCRTIEIYQSFRKKDMPLYVKKQLKLLLPKFRMSPRAILGLHKGHFNDLFRSTNRRLRKKPPPQRYIGVGYRDKGATTEPSKDGSPSWKEVAVTSLSPTFQWEIEQEKLRRVPLLNLDRFPDTKVT